MKVKEKAASFYANYGVMLTPRRAGMQASFRKGHRRVQSLLWLVDERHAFQPDLMTDLRPLKYDFF